MKVGFVSIFGKPNAGKSTLLNALMGHKLAIVSPKVQTTRHRIKGILTGPDFQVIFSDTPGIIEPKYKLQEKMMEAVKGALEDADLALLMLDAADDLDEVSQLFSSLNLRTQSFVAINKTDLATSERVRYVTSFFSEQPYAEKVFPVSALLGYNVAELKDAIIEAMPTGEPFYSSDDVSDLPTRFFVAELIREKIFALYQEEIPYHTAVMVRDFKKKSTLTKIEAEIIVQRETQKAILLGEGGRMIKRLGTEAREEIERFIDDKVFLDLFVKVRPKWRDNELFLKEYGF